MIIGLDFFFKGFSYEFFERVVAFVQQQTWLGFFVYVLLYVFCCLFLVPGSVLTLLAGAVYGPWWGTAIASIASVSGAMSAFLLGRFFFRPWVQSKVASYPTFKVIETLAQESSFWMVFLIRLSPLFPFNLLNYGFALTPVRWNVYVMASALGMLPGTWMYVYIGSTLSQITLSKKPLGDFSSWSLGFGCIVSILAVAGLSVVARSILKKHMEKIS
ncbi:MAG: TVP38/TMEM64 family protein [Bdellovibrionota bacterium]